MRQITPDVAALIKRLEGLRLNAYQDGPGVWTIGWGHTRGVKPGDRITKPQAERFFTEDWEEAAEIVERRVKVDLTDNQFGALVSFVFNLGEPQFASSTLLRKVNAGDFAAVPSELVRWNKSKDRATGKLKVDEGLANRRAAEIGMWARGSHAASNTIEATPARAPAGKADAVAGTTAAASVATIANKISENADTIQQVSWFLTGQGIIMIGAGIVLLGCLAYVGWSWYSRSRG
jgi:lysozyme